MRKYTYSLIVCLSCTLFPAFSQDWKEYRKDELSRQKQFNRQMKDSLQTVRDEYRQYVRQKDLEFARYLQNEWKAYRAIEGQHWRKEPKPQKMPVYHPLSDTTGSRRIDAKPIKPFPVQPITDKSVLIDLPDLNNPVIQTPVGSEIKFVFCHIHSSVRVERSLFPDIPSSTNPDVAGRFWETISLHDFSSLFIQFQFIRQQHRLNDYAYLLMLQEFSEALYGENKDASVLLCWLLLLKSGYNVKLAFDNDKPLLLIPSQQTIYLKRYLEWDGIRYYNFSNSTGINLYTYEHNYSLATHLLDFNIADPIFFNGKQAIRNCSFSFEEKDYQLSIAYDPDWIEFCKIYPFVSPEIYFRAAVSDQLKTSVIQSVKPLLSGMDELKVVGFLLSLVQTAFPYQTDIVQFGQEKYFFAEELLYYPYSDCEDRAVFFAFLVRELLGLKVVALGYPQHVATAVRFSSDYSGDYIVYKNDRYLIADPTYIHAPCGKSMPQFKEVTPIIIE